MGIFSVDHNNINLDHTNYDEDNPKAITCIGNLAWYIRFENCKALKKELHEELMLIAWHFLHVKR